jgi:hypothetical protein
MKALENPFVISFLNDMVQVGIKKWGLMTLAAALFTITMWGGSIIPMGGIIGLVLTLNLLFATVVTIYWRFIGKPKHAFTSILDAVEQNPRMERKDKDD